MENNDHVRLLLFIFLDPPLRTILSQELQIFVNMKINVQSIGIEDSSNLFRNIIEIRKTFFQLVYPSIELILL